MRKAIDSIGKRIDGLLDNAEEGRFLREGVACVICGKANAGKSSLLNMLLKQEKCIDLIIPRGGEGLIRFVVENSKIPVLKHYKGVCHVYVDETVDLSMAEEICFNAKVQRPGVCNAMETMLVHTSVAREFLPAIAKRFTAAGVEIRTFDAAGFNRIAQ